MASDLARTPVAPFRRERDPDTRPETAPARGTGGPSCSRPLDHTPAARRSCERAGAAARPRQAARSRAHPVAAHVGPASRRTGAGRSVDVHLGCEPRQRHRPTAWPRHCVAAPAGPATYAPQASVTTRAAPRSTRGSNAALHWPSARFSHGVRAGRAGLRWSRRRATLSSSILSLTGSGRRSAPSQRPRRASALRGCAGHLSRGCERFPWRCPCAAPSARSSTRRRAASASHVRAG
jgi:hypothetical protein